MEASLAAKSALSQAPSLHRRRRETVRSHSRRYLAHLRRRVVQQTCSKQARTPVSCCMVPVETAGLLSMLSAQYCSCERISVFQQPHCPCKGQCKCQKEHTCRDASPHGSGAHACIA